MIQSMQCILNSKANFNLTFVFVGNIGPIPALLQDVVDHFVLWQLIPEYKRPNGCIINFFEEVFYVLLHYHVTSSVIAY